MFWNKKQSFLLAYSAKMIMVTLVVAVILRVLFVSAYTIQSKSMTPTLLPGEFLIGWKNFVPRRGDVVVLPCVKDESRICIKRIVGIAGDRIEIAKQRVIVNTVAATYEKRPSAGDDLELVEKWQSSAWPISIDSTATINMEPVMVPPDHVFLLNDHRSDPSDSRAWGPVPTSRLEAKAWRIWISINWAENRLNWGRMLRRID